MPTLTIYTNVSKDKIPANFCKETTKIVAKALGKPESYVIVHVIPSQLMTMGGSDDPCAHGTLLSIGRLGVAENKKHAATLYAHIEKTLGIPQDRMYIIFNDADKSVVGYNGTTFHDLL